MSKKFVKNYTDMVSGKAFKVALSREEGDYVLRYEEGNPDECSWSFNEARSEGKASYGDFGEREALFKWMLRIAYSRYYPAVATIIADFAVSWHLSKMVR